jgi:hypothetical protein
MTTQLTLNQFDALTLAEKFVIFGRDLFTAKQFGLIQAVIDFDCYGERFVKVCDLLQVSKASLSGVISSLNYCGVVYTHKTFNQNAFKNVLFSARRLDCILYSHFIDLYTNLYIETSAQEITEETPAQETTEETPAQETTQAIIEKAQAISLENDLVLYKLDCDLDVCVTGFTFNQNEETVLIYSYEALIDCLSNSPDKTEAIEHFNHNLKNDKYLVSYGTRPFNKVPKRLKSATLKSYSGKQLARHLDRLQDHFIDKDLTPPYRVDFSYLEIRKYDQECDAYLFQGISKESIEEAVNDTYRLLGI